MKKKTALLSAILFLLTLLSCNNEKQKENITKKQSQIKPDKYKGMINPSLYRDLANDDKASARFWRAALDSGDCKAYSKIAVAYIMSYREVDLYYYSLIMANKYHCADAYLTMYTILTHEASPSGGMTVISNDKDTKNLALYYLFKAKELGSSEAKALIESELNKAESSKKSSFFLKQLITHSGASMTGISGCIWYRYV